MGPEERFGGYRWNRYADTRTGLVPNGGIVDIGIEKVDVDKLRVVNAGPCDAITD